jgi:hypothetical protein
MSVLALVVHSTLLSESHRPGRAELQLEQLDMQFRSPWSQGADGYFYWTNTYFCDLDNPPPDNTSFYWVGTVYTGYIFDCVSIVTFLRTAPPGSRIYVGGGNTTPNPGPWHFSGGYSLFHTARLSFRNGGKEVGYKRFRMPIVEECRGPNNEIIGDAALMISNACSILEYARITTKEGLPIEEVTCDYRVHMWGLRHGTKRSALPVLPYP